MKREMRRKDKLVTDESWKEDVLNRGGVIYLALATPDGDPYALPMGYGYEDGVIYLHGAAKGLKSDLIATNPRVSFNVAVDVELVRKDSGSEFTFKYRSVSGFGDARVITDLNEKNQALAILMRHYDGPHKDIAEDRAESVWVAKIIISELTGKCSGYPKP